MFLTINRHKHKTNKKIYRFMDHNLLNSVSWPCTRPCFSLTVYDVLTLNPLDVRCVPIDYLVKAV